MSKITSVEWLDYQLFIKHGKITIEDIYQAKEMEDAQRQKDFKAGNDSACMEHENIDDYFKQYIKSE